jgi:uncharacterized protein (UPF0371 family)
MGVNRAGFAIVDDAVVSKAATQEVIRRHFRYQCEYAMGVADEATVQRAELLVKELNATAEDRPVVVPAHEAAVEAAKKGKGNEGICCGAAMLLPDGQIVTGCNSKLMHASSSVILNAVKQLAEIPDKLHVLAPNVLESITGLKEGILGRKTPSLDLEETLIALSVSAASNPAANLAMEKLADLRGCDMHITHIPPPGDEAGLRRLGINVTSEPDFASRNLFET